MKSYSNKMSPVGQFRRAAGRSLRYAERANAHAKDRKCYLATDYADKAEQALDEAEHIADHHPQAARKSTKAGCYAKQS